MARSSAGMARSTAGMARLTDWLGRFERLSLRERGLIAAALLVGLYQVWDLTLYQPQDQAVAQTQTRLQRETAAVKTTEQQLRQLERRLKENSADRRRQEIERLERQLAGIEQRIDTLARDLISPSDMARLLEELLTREPSLSLLRLETLESRQVIPAAAKIDTPRTQASAAPRYRVFRHDFAIEFDGAYLATLRYLESLDQLPWRFYWDGIQYTVDEHPRGRVRLELHTLSFSEGWIGV